MHLCIYIYSCTAIRCSLLPQLDSGNIQYSNELLWGSVATYECDHGYNLVGPMNRTCLQVESDSTTGAWSGSTPSCIGMYIICMNPFCTIIDLRIHELTSKTEL